MKNYKRIMAVVMAATMVAGSSMVAFAGSEPVTSGNITGAGTSEGHVEKKKTVVQLPLDATDSTFAYTMDPERLISVTSHEKYGDKVEFPTTGDTGVYFNHGAKGGDGDDKDNVVYQNISKSLKVVNKSSHDIDLTVKAESVASDGGKDIPLVPEADIATATDASLYLGLVVGTKSDTNIAKAIDEEAAAETSGVTIAGTESNFKIAVTTDGNGYEYRELTLEEYKKSIDKENDDAITELPWQEESFYIEGAVTNGKSITSDTTAPQVKVTWSWVDPSAVPATTEMIYTVVAGQPMVIDYTLGNATEATSVQYFYNNTWNDFPTNQYGISGTTITFNANWATSWRDIGSWANGHTVNCRIVFDNDTNKVATYTVHDATT